MTKLEALENEVKSAALAVEFAIDLAVATNAEQAVSICA